MRPANFSKFNQYLLYPDLANKFLYHQLQTIPKVLPPIYLMYIFRQKTAYSFIAIKSLLMLQSLHVTLPTTTTNVIILKFSKAQSHSLVL
jgi:hypothetical protein